MNDSNHDPSGMTQLVNWYTNRVRPFLLRLATSQVPELDSDLARLKKMPPPSDGDLEACFLGSSGIGKSTLINALVAGHEVCVPAGGVGPLTAQALTVRFAETRGFRAIYHPAKTIKDQIDGMILQLHNLRRKRGEQEAATTIAWKVDFGFPHGETGNLVEKADSEDEDSVSIEESISVAEKKRRQARLLVKGDQNGDLDPAYLIDALRLALGQSPSLFGSQISYDDSRRMDRLRDLLASDGDSQHVNKFSCRADEFGFRENLAEHATGFLSPLIQKLDVDWNSPLLSHGISLIDLPGLGIEGDVYRVVTQSFVRERAKAVVLVVGNRGITQDDAQLLYTSGFLNRLLHSADETGADPVSLMIAVTRIDDIASTEYMNDKTKRKREHFADVRSRSRQYVTDKIRLSLEEAWSLDGSPPSDIKRRVIDGVIGRMRIYPVSAIEYRKCLAADLDDPAFIPSPDESGVPEMIAGLRDHALQQHNERRMRFAEAHELFVSRLSSAIQLIREEWKDGSNANQEAGRLRKQLPGFLQPLREQFQNRQGGFREFLKATLPQQIERLVGEAKASSRQQLQSYLVKVSSAHWRTLQAVVRRGGTFVGARHIDLSRDFAFTFEEPVAEALSTDVLQAVRGRTIEFADDCVALIEELAAWLCRQKFLVNPKLIEAHRNRIQGDAKKLKAVGASVVGTLREDVKNRLARAIEDPIREKCESFDADGKNKGTGVKRRILDLLHELADEALDAAAPIAKELLLGCCRLVEREIRETFFDKHSDPLAAVENTIAKSHEDRMRFVDPKERESIVEEAEAVLANRPHEVATLDHSHLVAGAVA